MQRDTWENTFMDICELIAKKRATCARLQTAALLIKDNNIISIGYNGVCPGAEHCYDYWANYFNDILCNLDKNMSFNDFIKSELFYKLHHEWANNNELHAEMNCIINAARNNSSSENSTMYSLYAPCTNCAKLIISSRIKKVYYKYLYKRDTHGIELLEKNNIICALYN